MAGFVHTPVMLPEVLQYLMPRDGGWYVDGTLGGAGHAEAVLKASAPGGRLFGCDQDADALEAAQQRLAPYTGRFELRRGNFAELGEWLPGASLDGVLMDLGVSSHQLEVPERGFSFMKDGPLDMRMDQRQAQTAADLVNQAATGELEQILWRYGDEKFARRIVKAIEVERGGGRIETTGQLADLVVRAVPGPRGKTHPATRVFQALRIAVNDELGALQRGLAAAVKVLKPGGRLVVITFHSLEDRLVKDFGREQCRDYTCPQAVDVPELRQPRVPVLQWVERKAVQPGAAEVRDNPRARSAQLRILAKL
ncbi:MAG: 16S rRNA (cytosine(1402)-N(4))-methyltransferase RsmH [Verrucomicrobiota bacterium]